MTGPMALRLAETSERWGRPPSGTLGIRDGVVAFAVNEALSTRLRVEEARGAERASRRRVPDDVLPAGLRYERPEDVD